MSSLISTFEASAMAQSSPPTIFPRGYGARSALHIACWEGSLSAVQATATAWTQQPQPSQPPTTNNHNHNYYNHNNHNYYNHTTTTTTNNNNHDSGWRAVFSVPELGRSFLIGCQGPAPVPRVPWFRFHVHLGFWLAICFLLSFFFS